MSSTFSLVEVTAEYLDSQASCTLPCISVLSSIMDKNPSAVHIPAGCMACRPGPHLCHRPSPVAGSKPQTQPGSPGTAQLDWCNTCHDTICDALNWPQFQVHIQKKKKKKRISVLPGIFRKSSFFENFIFFKISQITTFLSLRRLPPSKNVRFWYSSHLLSETYKTSSFSYSFAKKC